MGNIQTSGINEVVFISGNINLVNILFIIRELLSIRFALVMLHLGGSGVMVGPNMKNTILS